MHNDEVFDNGEALINEEALSEEYDSAEVETHSVVGIRFEPCGKVYCFKANGLGLKLGERVVVESDLGMSIGRVVIEDNAEDARGKELKPVLRRVSEEDLRKETENRALKKEAFDFCNERIMARGLSMKLLGTDVTLDKKRIVFFFSADNRIDFRELVKDLAAKFRTRIELRQVGVRDAARITGGLGVCGRELCCRQFLTSFLPISIKMAKKQELALNTSKLSGICGRLMCCLGYEYEEKLRDREDIAGKEAEEERPQEQELAEEIIEESIIREPAEEPSPEGTERVEEKVSQGGAEPPHTGKRRRRRRRRHGKRPQGEQPPAQEQARPKADRPEGDKPGGDAHEGEKAAVKKPFRRKKRRRMRGKKKE